ncbi:MAG: CvpA family protein [Muribaculaceae bacterium]|nr:CvpA family protein [Muribaculaceae bacterium]
MSLLDIILIAIAIIAAVVGAIKGFLHQAGSIVGLVAGIIVCRLFGGDLADHLVNAGSAHEGALRAVVYLLLFVVVFIAVRLIAGLFAKALDVLHIRLLDRVAGAVFSVGLWTLAASILINLYLAAVPADISFFENPAKPWRTAVAKFAPAVMGYANHSDRLVVIINNNE